jgi:hypothetical protein
LSFHVVSTAFPWITTEPSVYNRILRISIFGQVLDVAISYLGRLNRREDFFGVIAYHMKKHYDALLKVGFTKEQSTRIVVGLAAKPVK